MEGDEGVSGILKRRRVGERARELGADFTRLVMPRVGKNLKDHSARHERSIHILF